jgi:hypothetical protein
VPIEPARRDLIDAVREQFGWTLLCHGWSNGSRQDMSWHSWYHEDREWKDLQVTDDLRAAVRRFLSDQGWHLSRNPAEHPTEPDEAIVYEFLAPMVPVTLETGYHATRRVSLASIREVGLLPSSPEQQTTEGRLDCEGNIYVCERLGDPSDAGVPGDAPGAGSAYWWRYILAKCNRFNDRDWVILKLNLAAVEGNRTNRDIWSTTGVIVDNVDSIPPALIDVVPD